MARFRLRAKAVASSNIEGLRINVRALMQAAVAPVQFETVHPVGDGKGALGKP